MKKKNKIIIILIQIIYTYSQLVEAQEYFGFGNANLYRIQVNLTYCDGECIVTDIEPSNAFSDEVTFCPDGNLYAMGGGDISQINPSTGMATLLFAIPPGPEMNGFACLFDTTFFSLGSNGLLYLYNIIEGTVTPIGNTGFIPHEGLTFFNGEYYFPTNIGIVHLDVNNPSNSALIVNFPFGSYNIGGMTASSQCNTLIGINVFNDELVTINLSDGSISHLCSIPDGIWYLTSATEYSTPSDCEIYIDLDCDDSSGAADADFNSPDFNCLSSPVVIADEDVKILIDAAITQMSIQLIPILPDDPNEQMVMTGGVPGITVSGSGTTMITLTNTNGAKIQDFKDALHQIVYNNTAQYPSAGLRTVHVQFTTNSGAMSNIASAFIQVTELPIINVDLGPDVEICEGEAAILNAGNPGSMYDWSNGSTSQSITVETPGQYIVTVSDGIHCPNQDSVELDILPVIHVSLTGDSFICDNQSATLTIQTDSPIPLDVTIDADPGSPFVFSNVIGVVNFTDLPGSTTTYTINSVISDQPGCVEITNPTQVIDVYPTYLQEQELSLCDGDSIFLGFFWESEAGVYENLLETVYGCDSMVTTYLTILPAVMIQVQSVTCDPASAGVTIIHLDNPNGCDTILTNTVILSASDITNITSGTCVWTQAGIAIDTFINQSGCDSLVITTTNYIPPSDTTHIIQTTCDSSLLGMFYDTLTGALGCDSIVVLTVSFSLLDTTYIFGTSCIPSEIGVFDTLLTDAQGCDSLIITTITQGIPDTTLLFTTSCDPASLGMFEAWLVSSRGCDSLIITTVSFSEQDSTFISSSTCNPAAVGVFVTAFINQLGCDSIVTETVDLLPSDAVNIQSATCDTSAAGVFTLILPNQFGCDSIVTETVTLLPGNTTTLSSTTCIASEAGVFVNTLINQYGCDSIITEVISLLSTDTTMIALGTCDAAQTGSMETRYTGQDGCDSLVIETTTLFPLPQLTVQSSSDFNGYDISCFGEGDGSATAQVQGVSPFMYLWSTGSFDQTITGLSAGSYQVSVTDGNGCSTSSVIVLNDPSEFKISFLVSQPGCFGQQEGSITVRPAGGVAPYRYTVDGMNYQTTPYFTGLGEGVYQISALDANDCSTSEIIWINVPLQVNVELGDDQIISSGDSILLQAIVNIPFDSLASVMWSGIDSVNCPNCLTQMVAPIMTTSYSVSVTSIDGCADRDTVQVIVHQNNGLYVPNIFSPNGDNINDLLLISGGSDVEEITSFVIFDRWGNMVFKAEHFQANDPSRAWDGHVKDKPVNPAVYTYKLVTEFRDGGKEVRYGDVTLVK